MRGSRGGGACDTFAAQSGAELVEPMPWAFLMFEQEPVVEDGEIVLSDAPGLGLSFDARALDRCAARALERNGEHECGGNAAAAAAPGSTGN